MGFLDLLLDKLTADADEPTRQRAQLFVLALAAFRTGISLYLAVRG